MPPLVLLPCLLLCATAVPAVVCAAAVRSVATCAIVVEADATCAVAACQHPTVRGVAMMCAKVDASKEDERHRECLLVTASLRAAAIAGEGPERRFRSLPAAHLIVTQVIATP